MTEDEETRLLEKLARIEALHAGATTEGERVAAAAARDRIQARLRSEERVDPAVPFQFSLPDPWKRMLFCALARRYGLRPYRERGQRSTTVMLRAPKGFVAATFWPEFNELASALGEHLHAVTERVIARAIHGDVTEGAEEPKVLGERVAGSR